MVRRGIRLSGPDAASIDALAGRFAAVRAGLGVPAGFPADVLVAAAGAAAAPVTADVDLTEVPFITVDPPGSTDLDQALFLSRRDGGFHVDYAIADVPWFVPAGGPVDAEARRRGQTLYAPDRRTPLHPPSLSEEAASLLPDRLRPAFVWRFDLDTRGRVQSTDVTRALVRSRHQLDYERMQAAADGCAPAETPRDEIAAQAVLLREIGCLRLRLERERGGASLPLPEQEVVAQEGRYRVRLRPALPAEDWNAQLSLMTGMAAAQLMIEARVGLLRTLPGPQDGLVDRFRRQAAALGVPWPAGRPYGEFLRSLDAGRPADLALMHEAGALFRGAGYTPLTGGPLPPVTTHAAVAAPYAHVTAPLRRLVDRFGLVIAHAIRSRTPIPEWARTCLPVLPGVMSASDALAGSLDRACVDLVEAAVLADRIGETFEAVAVDVTRTGAKVQLLDPVVLATVNGPFELGGRTRVRLIGADPQTGAVRFEAADRLG